MTTDIRALNRTENFSNTTRLWAYGLLSRDIGLRLFNISPEIMVLASAHILYLDAYITMLRSF